MIPAEPVIDGGHVKGDVVLHGGTLGTTAAGGTINGSVSAFSSSTITAHGQADHRLSVLRV